LQAYTVLRYPLEPRKTDSASFDYAMALELLNRAEQDLEIRPTFIREVEKRSHMKVEAVIGFKPEAIKALCELCQDRIHALKPGLNGDGEKGDGEDEEDHEYRALQCLWFQRGRRSQAGARFASPRFSRSSHQFS
jgi:hypothetical protein